MTTYLECDSIVDDHGFTKHIRGVLWIGQLSIQIEPEVGVIVHLLVAKQNELSTFVSYNNTSELVFTRP